MELRGGKPVEFRFLSGLLRACVGSIDSPKQCLREVGLKAQPPLFYELFGFGGFFKIMVCLYSVI